MTNYAGYMGKVIRLDLGSRSVSEYPWTDRDRQLSKKLWRLLSLRSPRR